MKVKRAVNAALLVLVVLLSPACGPTGGGNSNDNGGGGANDNETTTKVPPGFPPAAKADFDEANRLTINGEIADVNEVLVFDLGPLLIGDRVDVRCSAIGGSGLDPMIALFDLEGRRVLWNDDVNPQTNNFDAVFSGPIRHDSDNYFLAVTSTNFFATFGDFRCTVRLQPEVGIAPLIGQTVLLRWTAAEDVTVSHRSRGDLPVFDAGNINEDFEDRTAEMQGLITHIVRADFAGFDVNVVTSDDGQPAGHFTTVFFGVSTPDSIFGIADGVDFYNGDDTDSAIVFLEALGSISNDFDLTALAIGNVVSHEIGHTLGLMHTNDVTELMDTTGADETLLADQSFGTAEVVDFPIGMQDAPLLLAETVGRTAARAGELATDGRWRCGTCGATLGVVNGKRFDSRQ